MIFFYRKTGALKYFISGTLILIITVIISFQFANFLIENILTVLLLIATSVYVIFTGQIIHETIATRQDSALPILILKNIWVQADEGVSGVYLHVLIENIGRGPALGLDILGRIGSRGKYYTGSSVDAIGVTEKREVEIFLNNKAIEHTIDLYFLFDDIFSRSLQVKHHIIFNKVGDSIKAQILFPGSFKQKLTKWRFEGFEDIVISSKINLFFKYPKLWADIQTFKKRPKEKPQAENSEK